METCTEHSLQARIYSRNSVYKILMLPEFFSFLMELFKKYIKIPAFPGHKLVVELQISSMAVQL